MSTLIFDIETTGKDWRDISPCAQKSLLKSINQRSGTNEKEKEREIERFKGRLALSPYTGQIVSLAMYDVERNLGAVYFTGEKSETGFNDDVFDYRPADEKDILADFWEGAREYDIFVGFNSRTFAVPFLYIRSAALGIKPGVEIANEPYLLKQSFPYHIDLLDQFTFEGAVRPRPSLSVLCDTFKIEYKPEFSGEEAAEFFRQKKFRRLARHAATDVIAIKELYLVWKEYLALLSFINNLEM